MANSNPQAGLQPLADAKGGINSTTTPIPISASNAIPLAVGSAVYISSGELLGTPNGQAGTEKVSGSIIALYTDSGKAVLSCPASTDGYKADITTDSNQKFKIRVAGTGITDADNGKFYSLTDETLVASTDGFLGRGFSQRELDSATEGASAEQFILVGRSGSLRNDAATDEMEVVVRINPVNFVQA